jgi:two-component system CheB/CheR fusion protein
VFEKTDLNIILQEIVSDLEVSIKEKKGLLTIDDMPVIDAVPSQIRQVFQNLVSNSLKFSRENTPPKISITSEYLFGDESNNNHALGPQCRIVITDNGIGFDQKFSDRIFVIFQRLHTREAYEGTGIGLAITKKIIDRHNGSITAESKENQGTRFTITLPIKNSQ